MVHEMSPTPRLRRSWPPIIPEHGGTGGTGHIRGHTTVRTRLDMVGSARRHACPRQENRPKAISHLYFHTEGVADGSALFQQLPYPPISVLGGSGSIPFKWVDCSGICGSRNANPGGGKGDVRIVRLSCTETVRLELEIIQKGQTVIGFTDAPLIRPGRAEPEICRSLHDTA